MFSFHKPRVYRSTEGCCICRAKSSSSRFTDSKKYEDDSVKCFNLEKPRQGEICNACVLLVKRFKRLPVGSNRHWGHVVDARIGPGMKSISKFKKLKEENQQQIRQNSADNKMAIGSKISSVSEKFCKIFRKNKKKRFEDKKVDDNSSDENSSPDTPESLNSDEEGTYRSRRRRLSGIKRRKSTKPMKLLKRNLEAVGFFDENDWVSRWACCGVIYENVKIGALIIDYEKCKPCPEHIDFFKSTFIKPPQKNTNDTSFDKTELKTPYAHNHSNIQHNAMSVYSNGNLPQTADPIRMGVTAVVGKNHSALKKHHLYYKRQAENIARNECSSTKNEEDSHYNKEAKLSNSHVSQQNGHDIKMASNSKSKHSFLHKIKSDANKLVKSSLEKVSTSSSASKAQEVSESKDTKAVVISATPALPSNVPQTAVATVDANGATKFSDNSSDSGFDENLADLSQLEKERKIYIRPIESLFIASTIPITIPAPPGTKKPSISIQKTIHTPQNIALLNNQNIRAIYSAHADGSIARRDIKLPLKTDSLNPALLSPAISSTSASTHNNHNKKIFYVKGKQNIEASNN